MSEMWHVLSCFDKALGYYSRVNNAEDGSAMTTCEAGAPSPAIPPRVFGCSVIRPNIGIGPPKLWQSLNVRLAWPGVAALPLDRGMEKYLKFGAVK